MRLLEPSAPAQASVKAVTILWAACLLALLILPCAARAKEAAPAAASPLKASQVLRLTLPSVHLTIDVPVLVYLPSGYGGGERYPVWYGMHGSSSGAGMWLSDMGIGGVADGLLSSGDIEPLIMVFPFTRYDMAREICADQASGSPAASRMERFLCEELVPWIDARLDTATAAQSRFIGGYSMGGYFALQIGLRHAELFGRIGAYNPALPFQSAAGEALPKWLCDLPAWRAAGGGAAYALAKGLTGQRVYIDCGTQNDPFAEGTVSLHETLAGMGVPTRFFRHEGGHSLQPALLADYLRFYCEP